MPWPTHFPDVYLIKNIWDNLGRRNYGYHTQICGRIVDGTVRIEKKKKKNILLRKCPITGFGD